MYKLEKGKEHSLTIWNRKVTKAQKQQENLGSFLEGFFLGGRNRCCVATIIHPNVISELYIIYHI